MIAIPAKKKSVGFKEAFKIDPENVRRLSLSEEALEKAVMLHGTEIVRSLIIFSILLFRYEMRTLLVFFFSLWE